MEPTTAIEAILFVASKPLSFRTLAGALSLSETVVAEAVETLKMEYNTPTSGIHILQDGVNVQMATNPGLAEVVDQFVTYEVSGELTKAQLETLTVVAYRGPVTRPELEQIRGVNCALIIRNLLVRGLIEETNDDKKLAPVYTVSMAALSELGMTSVSELPRYEELHTHEYIERVLQEREVNKE